MPDAQRVADAFLVGQAGHVCADGHRSHQALPGGTGAGARSGQVDASGSVASRYELPSRRWSGDAPRRAGRCGRACGGVAAVRLGQDRLQRGGDVELRADVERLVDLRRRGHGPAGALQQRTDVIGDGCCPVSREACSTTAAAAAISALTPKCLR